MCGRFALIYDSWEVAEQIQRGWNLEINPSTDNNNSNDINNESTGETSPYFRASFNVSPTNVSAVYQNKDKGELRYMKWGLVPSWTKDINKFRSYSTFNARVETIQHSKLWVSPSKFKRCAIPISGYYEWKTTGDKNGKKSQISKTPFYVTRSDAKLIFLAGMYDYVPSEDYYSFTIITGPAPENLKWLHDRMPVIIEPGTKKWDTWMDPEKAAWGAGECELLLNTEFNEDHMIVYQVSPDVGKTTNNGEKLIKPILKSDKNKYNGLLKSELEGTSIHKSLKDMNGFFNTKQDDVKIQPIAIKGKGNLDDPKDDYIKKDVKEENDKIKTENESDTSQNIADSKLGEESSSPKRKRNVLEMLKSSTTNAHKRIKR